MGFGGAALKIFQTVLYALTFCCAAITLGFYSYFLAVLSDRNEPIANWMRAVTGISGAACLYLIFAVILTCCLGGIRFFAFLAIVLDVLFCAGFVANAVMTRDGSTSCSANPVRSPLGYGAPDQRNGFGTNGFGSRGGENVTYSVNLGLACRYNQACFGVSIIGAFLFIISAFVQLWLGRHHQREKRYGPSPSNNYTSGSGSRFRFGRRRPKTTHQARDAEMANTTTATPAGNTYRPSHETGYTGTTAGSPTTAAYDSHGKSVGAGGYYTHPTGTGVNPYTYEQRTTATNY